MVFGEGSSGFKETIKGNASEGVHKKAIWKNDSRAAFVENIDVGEIGELCAFMDQHNNDNIDVDILVDKCNKILYNAVEKSGNVITIVDRNNSDWINSKPWYNHECKMLRKEYHRSKNYNRRKKTAESRLNMVRASRAYKTAINKQFKSYQNNVVKKLRDLQTTNPKAYWSIINRGCDSKQILSDISADTFLDHFKGLNQEQESDFLDISEEQVSHYNEELNR